jgi:hypothetical protein
MLAVAVIREIILTNKVSLQVLQELCATLQYRTASQGGEREMVRVTTTAFLAIEIEAQFVATPKSKPNLLHY